MNWYFIRHGQIASNLNKVYSGRSDETLTDVGREQVRDACAELANLDIDAIYCSPLTRTRQTADIIVKQLQWDIPIHYDDSFNEIMMGPWEGMAEREVERQYPKEWALWNRAPADLSIEGRETLHQVQQRAREGMESILRKGEKQNILVVTHVAIIRVVALLADGMNLNQYKSVEVGNAKIFNIELNI